VIHGGVAENRPVAVCILVLVQVMRGDHLVTFAEENLLWRGSLVRAFAVSSDNRLVIALSKIAIDDGGLLFARIQPHII
jgi:hypothetical protein